MMRVLMAGNIRLDEEDKLDDEDASEVAGAVIECSTRVEVSGIARLVGEPVLVVPLAQLELADKQLELLDELVKLTAQAFGSNIIIPVTVPQTLLERVRAHRSMRLGGAL